MTWQKRVFDALHLGCVPVVFEHRAHNGSGLSWFVGGDDPPAPEDSYPFFHSSRIDYRRLFVVVRYERMGSEAFDLVRFLEALPHEVVAAKMEYARRVAHLLWWDYSGAAPDAFSGMVAEVARVLEDRGVFEAMPG
jgi:hypothetical protein